MPGIERVLAAKIEHEGALVHEPHSLRGTQRGKRLDARTQLVNQHDNGGHHSRGYKIRMMANEL
jgi:hypothetical protein